MKIFACLVLLTSCLVLARNLHGATKFVSDTLYIPLKSDGHSGKVIRHLKSGTKLSVLETDDDKQLVRVRVNGGNSEEGWVKARYLLDQPIARSKLALLEGKVKTLEAQQDPLRESINDLKAQLKLAKSQNNQLQSSKSNLQETLDELKNISSDSVSLFETNKKLLADSTALQNRVDQLQKDNLLLKANQKNEGMKLAIFAVSLGCLAGFLLPFIKPRGSKHRGIKLR